MRPQILMNPIKNKSTGIKMLCAFALAALVPFITSCSILGGANAGSDADSHASMKKGITVWFCKANEGEIDLVPVIRSKTGSDNLKSAIDQLLLGPDSTESEKGLSSEIPKGTILLDIKKNGDNIEVNLSKRFSSGGGPTSMETRLNQLTKTVSEVVGDSKVYLNIEGTRLSAVGADGLEVKQPIN